MRLADINMRPKILLGIFSPLLLLIFLAGTVFFGFNKLHETNHWVEHTQKVLADHSNILTSAINIETGMRGYLLTGQEAYLQPYDNGKQRIHSQFNELRQTVSDNPPQVARLRDAESILHEWQDKVTQPNITLRRIISNEKNMHDIAQLAGEQRSRQFTSKIHNQAANFIAEEERLLEAQIASLRAGEEAQFEDIITQTKRTHKIIEWAREAEVFIKEMERALQNYLLSGIEQMIAPYHEGKEQLEASFEQLTLLISNSPSQLQRLEEITHTVEAWDDEVIHPMIELRQEISRAKTMDDLATLVAEGRGKEYFDHFRQVMAEFRAEEERLMALRKLEADETTQWVYATILFCTLGSLLMGGSLAYIISCDISTGVTQMAEALHKLSGGDKSIQIPGKGRKDEIGEMAYAADIFKAHLHTIEQLSITDELTGLYNRRKFNTDFPNELNRARRDKKSIALLMLDIDHFKHYNDTYGHQEGDRVLRAIGKALKETLLRAGDHTYRLGGEEFGIILSSAQADEFTTMAERIRANIEALKIPHANNTAAPVVTTSIGMMVAPYNNTEESKAIYHAADEALYRAKEAGRNRVEVSTL